MYCVCILLGLLGATVVFCITLLLSLYLILLLILVLIYFDAFAVVYQFTLCSWIVWQFKHTFRFKFLIQTLPRNQYLITFCLQIGIELWFIKILILILLHFNSITLNGKQAEFEFQAYQIQSDFSNQYNKFRMNYIEHVCP